MAKKSKKKKRTKVSKRITTARTLNFSTDVNIVIDTQPCVRPGHAYVYGGQQIIWWNFSSNPVQVVFTFDGVAGPPFKRTIDPGHHKNAPGVVNGKKLGPWEYNVYDLVTGQDIPGCSRPEIIVEG